MSNGCSDKGRNNFKTSCCKNHRSGVIFFDDSQRAGTRLAGLPHQSFNNLAQFREDKCYGAKKFAKLAIFAGYD